MFSIEDFFFLLHMWAFTILFLRGKFNFYLVLNNRISSYKIFREDRDDSTIVIYCVTFA